jgi:hypothetical protein
VLPSTTSLRSKTALWFIFAVYTHVAHSLRKICFNA